MVAAGASVTKMRWVHFRSVVTQVYPSQRRRSNPCWRHVPKSKSEQAPEADVVAAIAVEPDARAGERGTEKRLGDNAEPEVGRQLSG